MSRSLLLFLCLAAACSAGGAPSDTVSYDRDIRPVLSANCFACHGPDDQSRKAKLRLDSFAAATLEKDGIHPIQPGYPEQSEMIRRITATDPDDVMPPPKTGKQLTPAEIGLIRRWIQQGAGYDAHWSFTPLKRPPLPAVKNKAWVKNPVDAFILARLERERLKPETEADRPALIRRLSLDLTGLPPTPADIHAFLADKSPGAYEKVVDRLLATPAYGEHWARMWLDLARYADTKGYEKDQPRAMWRYRDWVIDAYNADLPYDQFTREQLAGDLISNASEDQLRATAFHRNTMTNEEGGTDDEEFRVLAVKDRVDTTAQVWMGLTMGCAKCHSHKYDPITHAEYYRFYALFNQTEDADRGDEAPTVPMPTAAQKQRKQELQTQVKDLDTRFWAPLPDLATRQQEWERTIAAPILWQPLKLVDGAGTGGSTITPDASQVLSVSGKYPETETNVLNFAAPSGQITAVRLEVLQKEGSKGPGRNQHDRNVVISEFQCAGIDGAVKFRAARADFSQSGWEAQKAIDGDEATGWAFLPQVDRPHVILFDLKQPRSFADGVLSCTIVQNFARLQLERFRLSVSTNDPNGLKPELTPFAELAALPETERTPTQRKQLEEAFRHAHEPGVGLDREIAATKKELHDLETAIANTPVMRELPPGKQRVTRVHNRGNFLDPGDPVSPGLPAAFGSFPAGAPTNRLGVAEWLISAENPLTARVAVNRAWARIFGIGIVETEEDFGAQGSTPTHPELLDWLACEFREADQWSWKRLLKTIVMSATYRQSARQDPAKVEKDPRDLWLSRSPRPRLSAETIRDQALAISGLLSSKLRGPSVMPPQPEGVWRAVYSGLKWETSPGEDRHRRALYTYWRRTSPYPAMTTFDAGSGEVCTVRRIRTNTPLQALVTLNDPAFFEAAGALGRRMSRTGKLWVEDSFECVLARLPKPAERERLMKLFETARREFALHPEAAGDLLKEAKVDPSANDADVTSLAAWTCAANVLLNLDETLTRP
jgi:mono/diheme cytochrome c family protein